MEPKEITHGKIESAEFGLREYCAGLYLTFTSGSWSVSASIEANASKHTDNCEWSPDDQQKAFANIVSKVNAALRAAKVNHVSELVGKPVEITFGSGGTLKSWRIFDEVL
ncbi:hypothetical protein JY97_00500 [Alkalispirochaeta odontotermitis]|nr:hypothetical protein JY97_00500 [Alkalispirochaeta odontotermitis]